MALLETFSLSLFILVSCLFCTSVCKSYANTYLSDAKQNDMKQDFSISIFLDTRRAKANGKFPVKLRAYTSTPRMQKLYPTPFEFTDKEFESIWNTTKPRAEHKEARTMLQAMETKAIKQAEKIIPFSFEQFEKLMNRKAGDGVRIEFHYETRIQELLSRGQISTASTYQMAMRSIKEFAEQQKKGKFQKLTFHDVTADWLKDFEYYLTEVKGRALTTASFYVRTLRTLFNDAISAKDIEPEVYPFGKRKYQTPAAKNSKRALNALQLKTLFEAEPAIKEQGKAKDFWFFSFACNGMNVKDIALLRWKDIANDRLTFYRAKTLSTSKANLKPIVAYLNSFTLEVIEKYGNADRSPKGFVFPILNGTDTAKEQRVKIQNFTRFINQHVKKLAAANGIKEEISTYWARHSFATSSIRKGASLELVSESLGHGNMKTTQGYFAGFDSDTKKELAANLMEF